MKLNIIILAAGEGKRMHSRLPKVLHQVGGVAMLEHVVNTAKSLNPANIYVVHGNGGEQVKETLLHLDVTWVLQKQQLGTGHAVAQVMPLIKDGHILILYGDTPLTPASLLQQLIKTAADDFGLVTANVPDPSGFGRIIRHSDNKIAAIVEQKDASAQQLQINEINTGILIAPALKLKNYLTKLTNKNTQGEYYLTDVIALAVADNKKIHAITATQPEEVLGANDKCQLAQLERFYQLRTAKGFMQQGLTLTDPNRFDLRGSLKFGKDVTIDVNIVIKGEVTLGNNVKILPNCVIEDAIIDDNATIGPFAHIRPGSHIKANAKVGNFVELKKTILGENSKANHLTYLGDTIVGKNVNIGAGTITCNYDGVNKFVTEIEDGVFIGSNVNLVAPIKVGKNATIGAGSTISKDAPADELTLARSEQQTIYGWKRPKKK